LVPVKVCYVSEVASSLLLVVLGVISKDQARNQLGTPRREEYSERGPKF